MESDVEEKDLSALANFDGAHADLTERIIGCAFEVHNALGPGFVEAIYENALAVEFERQKVPFDRQVPVEIRYAGKPVGLHRLDLLVEDQVIVELKAKDALCEADTATVLSYLKATGLCIALLLNFGTAKLGIKRLGNIEPRLRTIPKGSVKSV